jgi:hypothetical protein
MNNIALRTKTIGDLRHIEYNTLRMKINIVGFFRLSDDFASQASLLI